MAYRSDTQTKQHHDGLRQKRFQPKAREVLRSWARARELLRNLAIQILETRPLGS